MQKRQEVCNLKRHGVWRVVVPTVPARQAAKDLQSSSPSRPGWAFHLVACLWRTGASLPGATRPWSCLELGQVPSRSHNLPGPWRRPHTQLPIAASELSHNPRILQSLIFDRKGVPSEHLLTSLLVWRKTRTLYYKDVVIKWLLSGRNCPQVSDSTQFLG